MSIVKTAAGVNLNLALVRAWEFGFDPFGGQCVILEYGKEDTKMFSGPDRDLIVAALDYMAAQDDTDRRVDAELDDIMGPRRAGPETESTASVRSPSGYNLPPNAYDGPLAGHLPNQIEVPELSPELEEMAGKLLTKFQAGAAWLAQFGERLNVQNGGLPRAQDPTASVKRPAKAARSGGPFPR